MGVLRADGLLHESHIHCWDVHPIAQTAWPNEKLVPGFKCAYILPPLPCCLLDPGSTCFLGHVSLAHVPC